MANRRMYDRRVSFSKKLAATDWQDETVWSRGIPQTDDRGFLPTLDPVELAGLLFPLGKKEGHIPEDQMHASIMNLIDIGLLECCECNLKKCLRYTNFGRFQTLKNDRKPLLFCEHNPELTCLESDGIQCLPMEALEVEVEVEERRQKSKKNLMSSRCSDAPKKRRGVEYSEDFQVWWEGYPLKEGKKDAFSAYKTRMKEGFTPAELLTARDRYLQQLKIKQTELKFYKMAKTFLGPGGHVEEALAGPDIPRNCETCASGQGFCRHIQRTPDPGEGPCEKYEEAR